MKHAELRSIIHNVADSLASGIGLLIGHYEMDVFGEASRSPDRSIIVDFLNGVVVEGECSPSLAAAVSRYRVALQELCSKAGGSFAEIREAKVRYWSDVLGLRLGDRYSVTLEDATGRRSTTEYAGIPGRRVKVMDQLGRLRPKASV